MAQQPDLVILQAVTPLGFGSEAGLYARRLAIDLASVLGRLGLAAHCPLLTSGQPPSYILLTAPLSQKQLQPLLFTPGSSITTCKFEATATRRATALRYDASGRLVDEQPIGELGAGGVAEVATLLTNLTNYVAQTLDLPSSDFAAQVAATLGTRSSAALLACWQAEDYLALDPHDPDALDLLVESLTDREYERAANLYPRLATAGLLSAADALAALERLYAASNHAPAVAFALAAALLAHREGPRALQLTLEGLAEQQQSLTGQRLASRLYEMKRDLAAANQHAANATALAPESVADWERQGHLLASLGNLEQATVAWQQVVAHDPQNANALFTLGQAAEQQHDEQEARAYYQRAIVADGAHAHAHAALGDLLYRRKERAAARPHLERAASLDPSDHDSAFLAARSYEQAGEDEQSLVWYAKAAVAKADFWQANFYAANLHRRRGDLEAALRAMLGVLAIDPQQAQTLAETGALLAEMGRLAEAIPYLERAAAALPQAEAPRTNLARVRALLGGAEAGP